MAGNLVQNGDFSSGDDYWTVGLRWSVVDGKAVWNSDGGAPMPNSIYQELDSLVAGSNYKITFTLSDVVFNHEEYGALFVYLGGSAYQEHFREDGTYEIIHTAGSGNNQIKFLVGKSGQGGDTLKLDDVIVEAVGSARPLVGGSLAAGRRGLV